MWINHEDWYSDKEYRKAQDSWVWFYRKKIDQANIWGSPHIRFVKISEYYREGRIHGRLQLMDFKQFERKLTKGPYNFYCDYDWRKKYTRNHYKYNRNNGKHFQQNGTEKKVLSEDEQAKREWRKFKKNRRSQKFHKNYRGAKQQFKHDCARFHRNFEKQCIQKEDYDKLHHRTWKQCIDWWSYD